MWQSRAVRSNQLLPLICAFVISSGNSDPAAATTTDNDSNIDNHNTITTMTASTAATVAAAVAARPSRLFSSY